MYGFESTVLLPLLSGAALTAERLYMPAQIDAAIERVPAPRTMFTTPFHLRAWLANPDAARIEALVSATAPLSEDLAREAEARTGGRLLEIYGCTEAGQIATRRTAETAEWELFAGLRLRDQAGQAVVSGGHVEEPTPLQDVIEIRNDGTHFLLHGRFADMVNIAGKRNSIGYLNQQLAAIAGVKDGVFYMPDDETPDGITRLTAFVVAPGLTARQVLDALRGRIDAAFMPRPLHLVDSLPRQLTGKITREALRGLAERLKK
jgi:acyl-coenzyme A synthetase/AMP-(fatty) acid ligase